jgi:ankyrin repeat protein
MTIRHWLSVTLMAAVLCGGTAACADPRDDVQNALLSQYRHRVRDILSHDASLVHDSTRLWDGHTVLSDSAWLDFDRLTPWLLRHGADAQGRDFTETTALHRAASDDVAEPLLAAKADVKARDAVGNTPLHYAAGLPYQGPLALLLVTHGADVNAVNDEGRTPLFEAADRKMAQLLVEHGAKLDVRDQHGETALFRAVWSEREDVLDYLLSKGASPHVSNEYGESALHVAERYGDKHMVRALSEALAPAPPAGSSR